MASAASSSASGGAGRAGDAGGSGRSGRPDVLDRRVLNRALLARQLLLGRSELGVVDALEHLIGLQSQSPQAPYTALWCRLAGFDPTQLSQLLDDRRVVRLGLMRSTIFLVTADDARRLRPRLQPGMDRSLRGVVGPRLAELDPEAVAREVRRRVEAEPQTFEQLGRALAGSWPDFDPADLSRVARTVVPLVQIPPRGLWGRGGPAAHTSLERWVGQPLIESAGLDELVLRYLDAFGPASVADLQAWSGLTRLASVVEGLGPALRRFRDDSGVELFDRPEGRRPDPDVEAPVRLLGEFDNLVLSHVDRSRVLGAVSIKQVISVNGLVSALLLVDGFVAGTWRLDADDTRATLTVSAFGPLSRPVRAALADEAADLLAFRAPDRGHDLQIRRAD